MEDAMSEPTPGRPMDDDIDQAYACSHALAGDDRGPAASVRANVLAAAARIAAGEDAVAAAAPPLVPVAPPVAQVGRGREGAINLSSWRVRSGAALCALLLVCAGIWRMDQNGRLAGGVQVALAELRLAEPRTAPAPRDLPLPAAAAPASYPYAPPPPVVVDPLDATANTRGAAAKRAERDKAVVVAQLDEAKAAAAPRAAVEADALSRARSAAPAQARAPAAADAAAAPPPVALAGNAPAEQESATVTITAAAPAAPPQIVTAPPHAPSVLPRRVMLVPRASSAPSARAAPGGNSPVVLAEAADRRDVPRGALQPAPALEAKAAAPAAVAAAGLAASSSEPASLARRDGRESARADVEKRAKADLSGVVPHASAAPPPLHAAAARGDVDTLKALLSDSAVRVDAPDADGRTALLHAVLAQQPAAVRLLLAAGADPGRADRAGLTPRQAAQTGASAEIAVLLSAPR